MLLRNKGIMKNVSSLEKSCTVNQTAHHLSSIHGPFHLIEMDEHQRWDYMEI